ncbi:MAG: TonB-dependent receptor plug domain-containing protein [Alistipes sp.]|nr:TonB-dependent receptor plug domain-containing protein [Alistipes sp.]
MRKFFVSLVVAAFATLTASAQMLEDVPFNGLIVDSSGKPYAKVKITIPGNEKRTTTDKNGRFGLTNLPDDVILNLSHKNIDDLKVPVSGRKSLKIIIDNGALVDAQRSQELEDMGFNYVRKREQSTSSGYISGEELRRTNHTDLEAALLSRVSSLVRVDGRLQFRGFYSVNAVPKTLLMVDGMEVPDFSGVNVQEVESVTINKDGTSAYGLRGFAGVIEVKLRSL